MHTTRTQHTGTEMPRDAKRCVVMPRDARGCQRTLRDANVRGMPRDA